ncbi:MAG: nucleotidyl transferase [Acidobacteria bacterium]|nr:nucleotidyl transferase [Acidobacteriota bacterium]
MTGIILAAGMGTRLGALTQDRPKAMLEFEGRTLLDHQVAAYRRCGVEHLVVIGGYRDDTIQCEGEVVRYRNSAYDRTNMVESLMCARNELHGTVLLSYGDVLFEDRVLEAAIRSTSAIGVTVDTDWRPYWQARYGDITTDTETLRMEDGRRIVRIGQPDPGPEDLAARYIGLLRFSDTGIRELLAVYDRARAAHVGGAWQTSSRFEQGYLTDLLQEAIDQGVEVDAVPTERGWLEFDTKDDYELATRWACEGQLREFCALSLE